MPERWETEIRKLRSLEPTEHLAARVAEGPRGEPPLPPPTRQRVVAAVTAIAVFLVGGVVAVRILGTGPDRPPAVATPGEEATAPPIEPLVLELSSADGSPTATLRYGDQERAGVVESSTWCEGDDCTGLIADFAFYPPVSEYLVAPPGTPIEVAGDGTVARLEVMDPDGEPIADARRDAIPNADGRYVLRVEATWERGTTTGSASIFLGVQAIEGPLAAPDVLHVDCGFGAVRTDTAIVRTGPDGLRLVFDDTEGFRGFEIVTPAGSTSGESAAVGGRFGDERRATVPLAPGWWEIGCVRGQESIEAGDATVAFEVVDPSD